MIQANEVRIGNWFSYNGADEEMQIDTTDFQYVINGHITDIEPIPLTEERLVKFGAEVYEFDNGQANQYRIKDDLFVIRDGIICHYGTSVKLEYVHKLQNLYFALRGQELTPLH